MNQPSLIVIEALMDTDRVLIQIISVGGKMGMYFKFKGKFTNETCTQCVKVWSAYFDDHADAKFSHIWDCTGMREFELSAKKNWEATMKKYESQMNSIHMISDSIMLRGTARLMGKLFIHDLHVHKSVDHFLH